MSRAKRWVFTLNNPSDNDKQRIALLGQDRDTTSYLVVGREVGQSGTPHLQGFLVFQTQKRLAQCKAHVGERAHLEVCRGTPAQASSYCKKDGDFDEYGELPTGANAGKRTDFEELKEWIKEQEARPTLAAVGEVFPSLLGRYRNAVELFIDLYGPRPSLVDGQLKPWQLQLDELIRSDPDDRSINFVVDTEGNTGKSWLCRYWISTRDDVQLMSIGKRDDLAHAIDETKRIFCVDVPRGSMEYLQYAILEKLKDQVIFSPKYMSKTKIIYHKVHVIVFCNEQPDMSVLTNDRYRVTDIN